MLSSYKKMFSTPCWAYIIAFALAVSNIAVSRVLSSYSTWWKDLFLNLGYGVFASTVVSLLIDLGATKRKRDSDKVVFSRVIADLRYKCAELPSEMYTSVYEAHGYSEKEKHSFRDWTELLFTCAKDGYSQNQIREITNVIYAVSEIRSGANECITVSKFHLSNEYVTKEFVDEAKRLVNICARIERSFKYKKYAVCKNIILQEFVKSVKQLFKDLCSDYERLYNEEDYSN